MKTTQIKIKNLFGIKELELNGKSVELTGKNGVGKSSVIDAIKYALTNKSDRDYIIKQGEVEGEIFIETDTGISINRKPRTQQTDYKSVKSNGKAIGNAETFLREIFSELQLSPVQFLQMSKQEQNRIILDMIEYKWDLNTIKGWFGEIPRDVNYEQNILQVLNDIQAENGFYYQSRQDVNRDIRNKRAFIEDIARDIPNGFQAEKWRAANLSEIYKEIETRRHHNAQIEKAKQMKENYDNKIRGFQAEKEIALNTLDREVSNYRTNLEKEIAKLEEMLKNKRSELSSIEEKKQDKIKVIEQEYLTKVAKFDGEIAEYEKFLKMLPQDVQTLTDEANEIEKMKAHLNEYDRMTNLQGELEELEETSEYYTKQIEKARTLPGEILRTATLPIKGLTVENGIPLINGLPVSNLSEGEKLDLCVDVTIQKPGNLQIILIDGVEKLSTENRNRLYEKCKANGLQFIATRTDDSDDLTITYLD